MRLFEIKFSFGTKSTTSKILYLACDKAGETIKSAHLSNGFSSSNYNNEIKDFNNLRDMLANVIESEVDYKGYSGCDEETKSHIRDLIATKLISTASIYGGIQFPYEQKGLLITYNPVEFPEEIFQNENHLKECLGPRFI